MHDMMTGFGFLMGEVGVVGVAGMAEVVVGDARVVALALAVVLAGRAVAGRGVKPNELVAAVGFVV